MGKKSDGATMARRKRKSDFPIPGSNSVNLKFTDELKYAGNQEDFDDNLLRVPNHFISFYQEKRNKRTAKNNEENNIFSNENGNLGNVIVFTKI